MACSCWPPDGTNRDLPRPVPDLITKIEEYLAAHNTEPKPHLVLGGFARRLCLSPAIELFEGFRELR